MEREVLSGIAASPGTYTGRARVVTARADLSSVKEGDIVVARSAAPDLVMTFDRVEAFVTNHGGRSAHASVVAREFGIPGVVGTQIATEAIRDGSTISVDGSTGTVYLDVRK